MSSTAKRKLAAIVFADIAGYTDRSQKDEAGTLDARAHVERLIKSSTVSHHGRIVKTLGDGAMLEFASAVEAVSAALDIQEQIENLNREKELAEPIKVRVGVHVGDVVEEEGDLYGNAVNIASRVLAMAQPGGICITREVYVQIRPILKLQCAPVAGTTAHRLPDKVEVFAIVGEEVEGLQVEPRRRKASPAAVAMASLAALAVLIAAYVMFNPFPAGKTDANVHRILLPDWVSPGEWFEVDGGPRSADLAVYFGNRPAQLELANGKLRVKTPDDLPTAQTTICVFEKGDSKPLLNQQTEVIRINSLAMNTARPPGEPLGTDAGPNVAIEAKPSPSSLPAEAKPGSKPNSGSAVPASGPGSTPKLPAVDSISHSLPASPGAPRIVRMSPAPEIPGYDEIMASIGDPKLTLEMADMDELKQSNETMGKAFRSLGLAQSGHSGRAKEEIGKARIELKHADPKVAAECEAILKTAEAVLDTPRAKDAIRVGPRWAQAFAFSMNRGTRSLPGLMMIDNLIDAQKLEEAKRALSLLEERKDLTASERKAMERLQNRLKSATPPPAPKSPDSEPKPVD